MGLSSDQGSVTDCIVLTPKWLGSVYRVRMALWLFSEVGLTTATWLKVNCHLRSIGVVVLARPETWLTENRDWFLVIVIDTQVSGT